MFVGAYNMTKCDGSAVVEILERWWEGDEICDHQIEHIVRYMKSCLGAKQMGTGRKIPGEYEMRGGTSVDLDKIKIVRLRHTRKKLNYQNLAIPMVIISLSPMI